MHAMDAQPQTRSYYRVEYPLAERPHFLAGNRILQVLDCSEVGFRYDCAGYEPPTVGSEVVGRIRFRRGRQFPVHGQVVRVMGTEVVVLFEQDRIPLATIYDEQRYLRARYPMRY